MRSVHHKFNQVILLNVDGKDLTGFADADHAVSCRVAYGNEYQLVGDSLSVDQRAFVSFKHEQVSHFGNHEDQSKFRSCLHQNWEVAWSILSHLDVYCNFEFSIAWCGCADFHNMQTMDLFGSFLFTKAEDTVLVGRVGVGKWEICETSGITLDRLVLHLFDVVELHPCIDSPLVIRVKTDQVAPFAIRGNIVRHNLAIVQLGVTVKDLLGGLIWLGNIDVVDTLLANDTKLVQTDPTPVNDLIRDFALLEGGRTSCHIIDLRSKGKRKNEKIAFELNFFLPG